MTSTNGVPQYQLEIVIHKPDELDEFDRRRLNNTLMNKAKEGNIPAIRQLLNAKADPNARDSFNDTPLHKAAMRGHAEAAKVLLEHRADQYARNNNSYTPMNTAIQFEHVDVVKALTEAKCDLNIDHITENLGRTLNQACWGNNAEVVKYLLENKADVKFSPQAIFHACHDPKMLASMLEHKASIEVKKPPDNLYFPGGQPIHSAARGCSSEAVRLLLEAKADKQAKEAHGKIPLDYLAERVKYASDQYGMTPENIVEFIKIARHLA